MDQHPRKFRKIGQPLKVDANPRKFLAKKFRSIFASFQNFRNFWLNDLYFENLFSKFHHNEVSFRFFQNVWLNGKRLICLTVFDKPVKVPLTFRKSISSIDTVEAN